MRYLFTVLALGCGPVELPVSGQSPLVTTADLHAHLGEPCTIEPIGQHTDRWTYCVVRCDIAEWCQPGCTPSCMPRWTYDVVGGIVVGEVPPD